MTKKYKSVKITAKNKKKKARKLSNREIVYASIAFLVITMAALFALVIPKFTGPDNIKNKNQDIDYNKVEQPKLNIVDLNSKSRPYAVMINNIGVARPYQSGLQDAYIIYELIAEGGITRMMALFRDVNVDRIGTVRSSRHYYLDYVLENDAIYVHWGFSDIAKADIASLGINNINGLYCGNRLFWKDRTLPVSTEHTAYTKTDMIKQGISEMGYRTESESGLLLDYSPEPIDLTQDPTVRDASSIDVVYSNSTRNHYDYNPETKTYYRSVNGKAHTDYVTKEQYNFKNIIVYQVANISIPGDKKGKQELANIGEGEGYFITEGKAVEITWSKASRGSKTEYKLKSTGEKLVVNDGNTFIQIQPKNQQFLIS